MMRRLLPLVTLALGLAGGAVFARVPDRPWYQLDGSDWVTLPNEERQALMAGFLMGSGLADAEASAPNDSTALRKALQTIRREGRLRYAFAPHVYMLRMSDHYHFENHRPEPLWWVIHTLNDELRLPMTTEGSRRE